MTAVFLTVLRMSITAGYVILAVMVVRLLLRKMPHRYLYLLWTAVWFRLVCPMAPGSRISIFNAVFKAEDRNVIDLTAVTQSSGVSAELIETGVPALSETVGRTISAVSGEPGGAPGSGPVPLMTIAAYVWIAGAALMLFYAALSWKRIRSMVKFSAPLYDGVKQAEVPTAFILGAIRPVIYLPFGLSSEDERIILSHERCHIKRKDPIVRLFCFMILTVHWFNPLCWLAYFEMEKDMEKSCDEMVLEETEESAADYSSTLLRFSTFRRMGPVDPLAFSENNVKGRIINAMKYRRISRAAAALLGVLCAVVLAACGTNPEKTPDPQQEAVVQQTQVDPQSAVQQAEEDLTEMILTVEDLQKKVDRKREQQAGLSGMTAPAAESMTVPVRRTYRISRGFIEGIHEGIDFAAKTGEDVLAAYDGVVRIVGFDENNGNYIVIEHEGGIMTMYEHLSSTAAKEGDTVRSGDVIGAVGATGKATGPHLCFKVINNGAAVDPEPYIDFG